MLEEKLEKRRLLENVGGDCWRRGDCWMRMLEERNSNPNLRLKLFSSTQSANI